MEEIKAEKATVRIHGNYDQKLLEDATQKFVKRICRNKRNEKNQNKNQAFNPQSKKASA